MRVSLFAFLLLFSLAAMAQPGNEAALAKKYFDDGEFDAALDMYDKLFKRSPEEAYALRMADCYEKLGRFDEAEKFLDRIGKREDAPVVYSLALARLFEKTGKLAEADKLYEETLNKRLKLESDFIRAGAYLFEAGKLELAIEGYQLARKKFKNPLLFAANIAYLNGQLGQAKPATTEYLNVYLSDPLAFETVKLDILNLVRDDNRAEIEQVLLLAVEKSPEDKGLRVILYEFYLLAGNFREAFVQVKSLDRVFLEDGGRVFNFAETLRSNKQYDLSNEAFTYIVERKKDSPYYLRALQERAINSELKAFDQVPVDLNAIKAAVDAYESLINFLATIAGPNKNVQYFDVIYRQANLRVFYLNELERPRSDLEMITATPALNRDQWAQGRLLLGDILLMQHDYGNAKLTYQAIADQFKDRQMGAYAKFKLAQLSYFKGDFKLSQALLGAIKDNTSNDISNDAIRLNLLIMDNTGMDTTTTALSIFARAQLLVYQRSYGKALELLDSLAFAFPSHSLADEILWEKAQIFLRQNDIPQCITYLDRILEFHKTDIYADDALYTKAKINDFNLKQPEEAMKLYMQFLVDFPGSLFSVDVRKRVRALREQPQG